MTFTINYEEIIKNSLKEAIKKLLQKIFKDKLAIKSDRFKNSSHKDNH